MRSSHLVLLKSRFPQRRIKFGTPFNERKWLNRQTEIEHALSGNFNPIAIKDIKVSNDGLNNDIHASADYRAHLVNIMARRVIGG